MQTGFLLSFILLGFLAIVGLVISLYIKKRYSKVQNTPSDLINEILQKMKLDKHDRFVDLGAGDFRIVFEARKQTGAHCTGIEISPFLVFFAKISKIKRFGIDSNPEIKIENFLRSDLSAYNKIYANLDDEILADLLMTLRTELPQDAEIYLLNRKFDGHKPLKTVKINDRYFLSKYSIDQIK